MNIPLRQYWNLLVNYLKPQWRWSVLLAVLLFGNIALQLVNPQIMRRFIDVATRGTEVEDPDRALLRASLLFMGAALLQQAVSLAATYVGENVGWTATNALRTDLADHCLRLDMSFHNAHTPGEMIERVDGDVNALSNFFSQFVIQLLGNAVLIVGVLALLLREDWRVGLALGVFCGLALVITWRLRSIAVPHWEASRQASADQFGFLEERLAGTEDIRSCGAKPYVMRRFYELMRDLMRKRLKAGLMVNLMVNSTMLMFAVGTAVAFLVSAWLFTTGSTTIGGVMIITWYGNMLTRPIQRITWQMQELQRAGAGIARVRQLLGTESQISELPGVDGDAGLPGGALVVVFEDVSFGYDDSVASVETPSDAEESAPPEEDEGSPEVAEKEIVLHDLSFHLQPGAVLGLLGRTGSGKTTLTRLLFRFYDPDKGTIYLGGDDEQVDIRRVPIVELRKRVGMVTQNIQLFHASIRDNLTFFRPGIPDEQLVRAIEDLGLSEWYWSQPDGLDTELESGGGGLSAGEAQLLAFTRIFLQDPGLVILDEASSRLDPATEHLIERAVDKLVQGRTAIVIAHRLGTVQRADEIMILENGRVRESGARNALAADPDSRFYSLLQTGLEEVLV